MFRLSAALLSFAFALSATRAADSPVKSSFDYGKEPVRGVNIGGWLVLEPWITPSLFDSTLNPLIIDEYTFGQYLPLSTAQSKLKQHWDTWFTEQDFKDIAAAGLNHVRIPIGYWAFEVKEGEPYVSGQLPYLQKAMGWAEAAGLKVIIDLHGVPGSQNGYDNSGQKLDYPSWQTKQENIDRSKNIIKTIAEMFTPNATVAPIIAPLNEPAGFYGTDILDAVDEYFSYAYDIIRHPDPSNNSTQSSTMVLLHDAFMNGTYWSSYLTPQTGAQGVMMDTHQYQVFLDYQLGRTEDQHIQAACDLSTTNLTLFELPVIVGEWSPAITDCARYLNGRGVGSRWDGTYPNSTYLGSCTGYTGSPKDYSDEYKEFLRKYWEAHVVSFERLYGWIQWTWKVEEGNGEEWAYKSGIENGWIPKDAGERKYPGICG